jgi:threonine synthase
MQYLSTRGRVHGRGFADVLIEGMATDGGLYVPDHMPTLPPLSDDYAENVATVVEPFVAPDPLASDLGEIMEMVYGAFRHAEVAPLREMGGDRYLLELFWGPTLSFKDYALQLLAELFDRVLSRRGERLLVLGATSGDTGSAAIEACRGRQGIDIVILYPDGAVSEVQRRQMTTVPDGNVLTVAVEGSFDDCQRLVKAAFATFRGRFPLGAINSINWARIMAQSAYYAHTARRVGEPVDFVVPTGNFGNVLAGHIARRMGAPISRLTVANNANRGLTDLIQGGTLKVGTVTPTVAPAMDIQVPSNLERYLFEALDGDGDAVRALQDQLGSEGQIDLPQRVTSRLGDDFTAAWLADLEAIDVIRRVHDETGVVIDPHTAVAWGAAERQSSNRPTVIVSTAHPAKFADVVETAVGQAPLLPDDVAGIMTAPERITRLEPDLDDLGGLLDSIVG